MPSSPPLLQNRRAGVLLHPTSLPGPGAQGTLGPAAFRFIDLLADSGFAVWQMLPVGPVDQSLSPYSLKSAHAGNPALIDLPAALHESDDRASSGAPVADAELEDAARQHTDLDAFIADNESWLLPFAYFELLRRRHERRPWWEWPEQYRERRREALEPLRTDPQLRHIIAEQYFFEQQWQALHRHARARDVALFGDLPFYVDHDSADVWWHRELFLLDEHGRPTEVAGVPPDYFSADGQLWGNPLFDWEAMQAQGFAWWMERLKVQLRRFDFLRIDHFRALESYWAVPADAPSARSGEWKPAPGAALLERLRRELGSVPLIVEDLGVITDEVRKLRDDFGLPGMLVLQFAFDGSPDNPYLPERHPRNAVVYTGTHDNDTTLGWYAGIDDEMRRRMHSVVGGSPEEMPAPLIRCAYQSQARLAVIPMQDLLGLGSDARMNVPGVPHGNWRWRLRWEQVDADFSRRWLELARETQRTPEQSP